MTSEQWLRGNPVSGGKGTGWHAGRGKHTGWGMGMSPRLRSRAFSCGHPLCFWTMWPGFPSSHTAPRELSTILETAAVVPDIRGPSHRGVDFRDTRHFPSPGVCVCVGGYIQHHKSPLETNRIRGGGDTEKEEEVGKRGVRSISWRDANNP